jgi:protein-tyrosine phosphatase
MNRVLFLCSGNYYRSRFAEHFFNWLAENNRLKWRADSRGLTADASNNIGSISRFAVEALKARGIPLNSHARYPQQATEDDLNEADLVIALKEAEHRPVITALFPQWADQIEYWHIDDLDGAGPDEALPLLELQVRALAARLRASAAE